MDLFLDGIAIAEYIHSQHRPHSVFPVAEFALFCVRTVPDEKCNSSALQAGQIATFSLEMHAMYKKPMQCKQWISDKFAKATYIYI